MDEDDVAPVFPQYMNEFGESVMMLDLDDDEGNGLVNSTYTEEDGREVRLVRRLFDDEE